MLLADKGNQYCQILRFRLEQVYMRHEFHDHLNLSRKEENLLENHSFLNLFNVLELQLAGLAVELPNSGISKYSRFCLDILDGLEHMSIRDRLPEMQAHCSVLRSFLDELRDQHPGSKHILDGLIETTRVGHARLMELEAARDDWTTISSHSLDTTLRTFLDATSVISGDRFSFSYSPEPHRPKTYWVDFAFGINEKELDVPFTINDTIRDLVSNSRKYSEPGSSIRIRINQIENNGLKLAVSDQGIGIPEDEIHRVIEYGYRATNAMDRRTMGGGIGLTKAYQLSRKYNGRFVIDSEIGKGTLVEISLFPPS